MDGDWTQGTTRNTRERRDVIDRGLCLDNVTADLIVEQFPFLGLDGSIVIADEWEEWRTAENRNVRDYYWSHYRSYLEGKNWQPLAIAGLDDATEDVIRRVSDPAREEANSARGLVVGHVQSGKTANFTGVIAKAVDAGYRLIIVLTGTTNMLRAQTQRRLDMELCGRENIEREISSLDAKAHEYADDPDWTHDRFVRHGGLPSDSDTPTSSGSVPIPGTTRHCDRVSRHCTSTNSTATGR